MALGVLLLIDLIGEPLLMALGLYSYPGAVRWLTIFDGHRWQYPIYEGIFLACWLGGWGALYSFRDDRGQTWAERGFEKLRFGHRVRSWTRALAIVGALQGIFFVTYTVPMQWFALHADPWPSDVLSRSYLTNGLCGPETGYACSNPAVPIPRPGSIHLDDDGRPHTP